MSYGVDLFNLTQNTDTTSNKLQFYSTSRGSFSTSDVFYFNTMGFSTTTLTIQMNQFATILSNGNTNLSNLNQSTQIDINLNGGWYTVQNFSRPTIVNFCNIVGYETGVGNTVFNTTSPILNQKVLLNYSDPTHLYSISTTINPFNNLSVHFDSFAFSSSYIRNENFLYVTFNTSPANLFFLATYNNSAINWMQIPNDEFFYNVDYYLTQNLGYFNGTYLNFSQFNRIIPSLGQLVLVNCASFNDSLSGIYKIIAFSSTILIQKYSAITSNWPGQTFNATVNLDLSNNISKVSAVYYVSFSYGASATAFSKALCLAQYQNINTNVSNFLPTPQDNVDQALFKISLTPTGNILSQQSDQFKIGLFVSNWCPDNGLIYGGFGYTIYEG